MTAGPSDESGCRPARARTGDISMGRAFPLLALALGVSLPALAAPRDDPAALRLTLRSRTRDAVQEKTVTWDAKKTAIIVCDMWDDHWCKSAARRVGELAGPLNEVLRTA